MLDCFTQHEPYAFGRQPIPVLYTPIVGLGIRQAESGLVKKQERGLQRLETAGFNGLAAVVRTLAVCARLSWENARLVATTGQVGIPAQLCRLAAQRRARLGRWPDSRRATKQAVT